MFGSAYGSSPTASHLCNPINHLSPLADDKTKMFEHFITKFAPKAPMFENEIERSSSDLSWKNEYSEFLNSTFDDEHFAPLLSQEINEEDLKIINCPLLNKSTNEQKKKFYILYLAAISEASSDYNPKDESYSKSDKTTNYGLLQIDPKSAERHASSVLERPIDKEHLTDYKTNLKAGAYILKHQISGKIATGRLFPKNVYYWPVLKNSKKRILKTFQKNSKNLPFCNELMSEAKVENSEPRKAELIENGSEAYQFAPLFNPDDIQPTPVNMPGSMTLGRSRRTNKETNNNATIELSSAPVISEVKVETKRMPLLRPVREPAKVSYSRDPELNEGKLETHLKTRKQTENSCAKGVRQSLNVLFGNDEDYAETDPATNALNFNEKILSKWKTSNSCFKETANKAYGPYQNYDIRVLQPKASDKPRSQKQPYEIYGHIEFYLNGRWYSDNTQVYRNDKNEIVDGDGSVWDGWYSSVKGDLSKMPYGPSKLYRLSNCKK